MKIAAPAVIVLAASLLLISSACLLAADTEPVTTYPITLMDAAKEGDGSWKQQAPEERVNLALWQELAALRDELAANREEQERLSNALFFLHRTVSDMQVAVESVQEQVTTPKKSFVGRNDEQVERLRKDLGKQADLLAAMEERGQLLSGRIERLQAALETQTDLREQQAQRIDDYETEIADLRDRIASLATPAPGPDGVFAEAEAAPAIALDEEEALVEVAMEDAEEEEGSVSSMLDERAFDALIEEEDVMDEDVPEDVTLPEPAAAAITPAPPTVPDVPTAPRQQQVLSADDFVTEGNRFLSLNQLDEAMESFKHALKLDPRHEGARLSLASCYYTRDDFQMAKRHIRELLYNEPEQAQALGLQGIISWREGKVEQAAKSLRKAVRLDPKDAQLRNYMGIVYYAQNEFNDALKQLRKAVDLDPEHAEARFNLAVLLASSDKPMLVESREHYETALRLGNKRDQELEDLLYP